MITEEDGATVNSEDRKKFTRILKRLKLSTTLA